MMDTKKSITLRPEGFTTPADRRLQKSRVRALATKDHDLIRNWAERHHAEPATGEETASGPATTRVNDGGAGIRFNFPGFSRFRPISWAEWFDNFDRHTLTFVFEEEVADRAYEVPGRLAVEAMGTIATTGSRLRTISESPPPSSVAATGWSGKRTTRTAVRPAMIDSPRAS